MIEVDDYVFNETKTLVGKVLAISSSVAEVLFQTNNIQSLLVSTLEPVDCPDVLNKKCASGVVTAIKFLEGNLEFEFTFESGDCLNYDVEQIKSFCSSDLALIPLELLNLDSTLQQRVGLNPEIVATYRSDYLNGDHFPPILVYLIDRSYYVIDGFHRVHAYKGILDMCQAKVVRGTLREAILESVKCNATHGLQRTNDDKRKCVMTLLADADWSKLATRELAQMAKVSHTFVANVKRSLEELDELVCQPEQVKKPKVKKYSLSPNLNSRLEVLFSCYDTTSLDELIELLYSNLHIEV